MKITQDVIKNFELSQELYGTKIALGNILWDVAAQIYKDLGVTRIRTSYKIHESKERKRKSA